MQRKENPGSNLSKKAYAMHAKLAGVPVSKVRPTDNIFSLSDANLIATECGVHPRQLTVPVSLGDFVRVLQQTSRGK